LNRLLVDNFILVDVLSGSEIEKAVLLALVGSSQLTFDEIRRYRAGGRVRFYGSTAAAVRFQARWSQRRPTM